MDNLPPPLILEILSRLADSSDLARCRLTCNTLNSLSYEVTSINLICSFDRYTKSRSSPSPSLITPFKSIVDNLIAKLSCLESISIGVDNVMQELSATFTRTVVDSPPVLATADAGILAGAVHVTVLVVRARRTTEEELADALTALEATGARVIGTVLTDARVARHTKAAAKSYRAKLGGSA